MKSRLFVVYCAALTAAMLCCAGAAQGQTQYFAVFMDGKKAGHAVHTRTAADGNVVTTQKVRITAARLGMQLTVEMSETHIETADGKPLGFKVVQDLGMMAITIEGRLDEQGKLNLTTTSMGSVEKAVVDWPEDALMSEGLRLIEQKHGLKQGTNYTTKVFSAAEMRGVDVEIQIGPKQNVDLLGRVVALTEVKTIFTLSQGGQITSFSYVDDQFQTQKDISSVMGLQMEMVGCTKEFALGQDDVPELMDKMSVASPQPLDDVRSAESISYQLKVTGDANHFKIPSTDCQTVKAGLKEKVVVTVRPVAAPKGAAFPYKGTDKAATEALKPTTYLQSERREIIELARRAAGGTKDAAEAVAKIEAFVADYIENKSLSVGYASAAEVAASKQGDCTEFAVLTAAMCRAVGIPVQVVVGVAYVRDLMGVQLGAGAFYGHAWTQAYVGGKWVSVDAAFKSAGRGGYGPGHIALAVGNGDPADFFSLVNTIGQFEIEKATVNKRQ